MNTYKMIGFFAIVALVLVACGPAATQQPPAAVSPSAAVVQPTAPSPTATAEVEEPSPPAVPLDLVVGITWQWAELIETEPANQSLVPDPENYTLVLRSDDTYRVKADCNVGSGGYIFFIMKG